MTLKLSFLVLVLLLKLFSTNAESEDDIIKRFFNTNNNVQNTVLKKCENGEKCVARFNCNNGVIIKDGQGIFDQRMNDPAQNGNCPTMQVCCNPGNIKNTPLYIPPKPAVTNENIKCGYRNPNGLHIKLTGDDGTAQFGEFPWMAAILHEIAAPTHITNAYECGGSIIAPKVVLTSAHCVAQFNAEELFVRAGEWDTQTDLEPLPKQDRNVSEVIIHENYNKGNHYNNIALLFLKTPFIWDEHVRPICLPAPEQHFDFSRCYVTGWGKSKFEKNDKFSVILKKIDLPTVPSDRCQMLLRATRLSQYFELHESFMCAGGERGKDACLGDGGSPLVCPIPGQSGRYKQAGIVSWGIGCGSENIPGVYANVAYLREWLDEKFAMYGIDFRYFTAN